MEPAKEAEKKHLMGLKEIQGNVWSGKSREKSASEGKERSPMPAAAFYYFPLFLCTDH